MTIVRKRSVLSGMLVKDSMRRQVVSLSSNQTLSKAINHLIRFKSNALLVTDDTGNSVGIVSKTDIMTAYYAGLPVDTLLGDIMVGPPLVCFPDDELEKAIDFMQQNAVHRLYVTGPESNTVIGVLAYPDVVGQLYRLCRSCEKGRRRDVNTSVSDGTERARVKDVMIDAVVTYWKNDLLEEVIEGLSAHGFGAILIADDRNEPIGVISKTDVILAFHHGHGTQEKAASVMISPVHVCDEEELLVHAIKRMLMEDVQRLFVYYHDQKKIAGVLSLSDAARFRSGTCRACMPSRIMSS